MDWHGSCVFLGVGLGGGVGWCWGVVGVGGVWGGVHSVTAWVGDLQSVDGGAMQIDIHQVWCSELFLIWDTRARFRCLRVVTLLFFFL